MRSLYTIIAVLMGWAAGVAADGVAPTPAPAPAATPTDPPPAPVAEEPVPAGGAHAFRVGELREYSFQTRQTVQWKSADDVLRFDTLLQWKIGLRCTAVADGSCTVVATVLAISGSHVGPGAQHRVNTLDPNDPGRDDALLGHLHQLALISLTLTLDPQTGKVSAVQGGDEIVKRFQARYPSTLGGPENPIVESARKAYGSEALAAWWSKLLALPPGAGQPSKETLVLDGPMQAQVERTWNGGRYTLGLPAGALPPQVQLSPEPAPVQAQMHDLKGSGVVVIKDGLLGGARGEATYTLKVDALTQPVEQQHKLVWTLTLDKRTMP